MNDEQEDIVEYPEQEQNNAWMMTFADLLSLTLTFFVLLFSMSTIEIKRWEEIVESLAQRLNPTREEVELTLPEVRGISKKEVVIAADLDYLHAILIEKVHNASDLGKKVTLRKLDDRLVISLASDALFAPGAAELSQQSLPMFLTLAEILSSIRNRIDITGHTDPVKPALGGSYPSNWELSLARATTIANRLRRLGYISPIRVFGLGSSRSDEIAAPELSTEGRYALARRVDIVVRDTLP